MMYKVLEVVFLDELLGDIIEMYSGIFKLLQRCVEVEVFDVKSGKLGTRSSEKAVDEELDEFKGAGGCANITRVTYAIASYGLCMWYGSSFWGWYLHTTLVYVTSFWWSGGVSW